MKKNRIKKLWTLSLAAMFILTAFIPNQEVNAKGVTKKTVTIRAGQKKKIQLKQKNVKKIKAKSNKKSVATVKAAGKKAIRITGKKAGKAVITVKIITKKKKVKTIQYKVTVKKKKTSDKKKKDEDNTPKQSNTLPEQPENVKAKYNYELKIMNSKDKNLYNNSKVVIYVKTNNPDPYSFKADCGTSRLVKKEDENGVFYTTEDEFHEIINVNAYDDVHYTGKNNAVAGGYLQTYIWDTPGTKNFTIQEKVGETWVSAASMKIQINDVEQAETQWVQNVLAEVTDDTMTKDEKLEKVRRYVLDNFKYDRNNENGSVYLLADVGIYWERKYIDCWDATDIMCRFAKELGLESRWTYAGYKLHYYATITIDGEDYDYDACPMSETGWTTEWEYVL